MEGMRGLEEEVGHGITIPRWWLEMRAIDPTKRSVKG